jgi:hypothetical protein
MRVRQTSNGSHPCCLAWGDAWLGVAADRLAGFFLVTGNVIELLVMPLRPGRSIHMPRVTMVTRFTLP